MYRFCVSGSVYSLYLDINLCLTPKKLYFQNRRYKSVFSYIFLFILKNKQKWPRTGGLNFCYFFTIYNVFYYICSVVFIGNELYSSRPTIKFNQVKIRTKIRPWRRCFDQLFELCRRRISCLSMLHYYEASLFRTKAFKVISTKTVP